MTTFTPNIRTVLSEVKQFLVETLKGVKLSGSAKSHKDRLLEKVQQLLDDLSGSTGSQGDGNISGGSFSPSAGGDSGSSSGGKTAAGEEESRSYSEGFAKVSADQLKNKLQAGLLDKKKKKGLKNWEQMYCIVSNNNFYIYKKAGDKEQKDAFCLKGYEFREAPSLEKDINKKDTCFELSNGTDTFQFRAASREGLIHWREAITKGMQMEADDGDGETYEDIGQENFPAPPPEADLFDDTDSIYEECGEQTLPSPQPSPALEVEVYDECASGTAGQRNEEKKTTGSLPFINGKTRRDPPPVPSHFDSPLPPPPQPKVDALANQSSEPPPIPDRRTGTETNQPPPLPSNPPPFLSGRGAAVGRVPQLRKTFMDREEDFENIFYGKWDCTADSSKELTFKQGDMIHVLSQDFDVESWWVGELEGRIGLVPKEYLCPAFELVA